MTTHRSRDFDANRAALAALLNDRTDDAAQAFARIDSVSVAAFVTANKLEFQISPLLGNPTLQRSFAPEHVRAIETHREEQRERQGHLLDELWFLADTLEAAGIPFILLMGLYFADVFYGGIENRFSWDLDVLVRTDDARQVDRVLRRRGYFRRSAVLVSRALTARFTHAFDYGNVRPRFSVDLHWLLSRHPSFRVDEAAIWASRKPYTLFDRRFDVLSHEYEIVSNALSTFRDIQRGAIRLRAFVDLFRVLEVADGTIDWNQFLVHRRNERIAAVTVNVLALVLDLLECRDRFHGAAGMVAAARDLVVPLPDGGAATFFEPGTAAMANRDWTSRVYECSRFRVATWWLFSLPFRMAVYRSGRRYAIFKRRLHVLKARARGRTLETAPVVRRPMR